jgi:hypothetical protein
VLALKWNEYVRVSILESVTSPLQTKVEEANVGNINVLVELVGALVLVKIS